MSTKTNILLIGCGKMGGALLRGWLEAELDASYTVVDPHLETETLPDTVQQFKYIKDCPEPIQSADIVILAVKPQIMATACTSLAPLLQPGTLVLSIAAGQSLANFESHFGTTQPVIRAMPNTPAAIGKGISVAVPNASVTEDQKALAQTLMETAGLFAWVEDEALMNAVTALSGSGPAYVFYLIEVLEKAGIEIGLAPDLAATLARQTVIGAAALADAENSTPATTLRENVTSPGGTTAAALEVLMDGKLEEIFKTALTAAKKRGEALSD